MSESDENKIRDENHCLEILLTKDSVDRRVFDSALNYAWKNFMKFYPEDDFLQLKLETFRELLDSDELNIPNEELVFDSVRRWLDFNHLNPLEHLKSILNVVRLRQLTNEYLLNEVEPYVYPILDCRSMFIEVIRWNLLTENKPTKKSIRKYQNIVVKKGKIISNIGQKLISIGSRSLKTANQIEIYDENTERWFMPNKLAINRRNYTVALIDEQIMIIGGTRSSTEFMKPLSMVESLDLSTGIMTLEASLNDERQYAATAVIGKGKSTFLYVLGGLGKDKILNSVERWDPVSRAWIRVTSMSKKRSGLAAAVLNNKIYVLGGDTGNNYTNTMEAYNIFEDKWEPKASMRRAKAYFCVSILNGFLYAIAGYKMNFLPINTVEKYDSNSNSWTTLANVMANGFVGVSTFKNRLICAGGLDSQRSSEYDEENNIWLELNDLHVPREGFLIELPKNMNNFKFNWNIQKELSHQLLSIGSFSLNTAKIMEIYDKRQNQWIQLNNPNMRKKIHYGIAIINEILLIIGGTFSNESRPLNSVESFNLVTGKISEIAPMNVHRCHGQAVVIGEGKFSQVYVFGGWGKNEVLTKTVERWDPISGAWTFVTPMRVGRTGHGVALLDDNVYIVGGRIGNTYQKTVEAYNFKYDKWTPKASLNNTNAYFGITTFKNCIYVAGGNKVFKNPVNTVEKYDPVHDTWSTIANISSTGFVGITTLGLKLICAGGVSSKNVEEYDEVQNTWNDLPSLNMSHAGYLIELSPNIQNNTSEWDISRYSTKLISIGSYQKETRNIVELYDINQKQWKKLKFSNIQKMESGISLVGNQLIIVGGEDVSGNVLNTVESIDLLTGNMKSLPPLKHARRFPAIVSAQEEDYEIVYAMGGWGKNGLLKSVEKWNNSTNSWTEVTSMTSIRTGHGAVLLRGKIYVAGGRTDDNSYLDIFEAYDIKGDYWELKAPMKSTNGYLGIAAFKDYIYIVGGNTQYLKPISTLERYDPIENRWTSLANIESKGHVGVCSIGDKLIYAGGESSIVQEYDVENNKWISLPNLEKARKGFLLKLPESMNNYAFDWK